MTWVTATTTGVGIGLVYFYGLWLTVRRVAGGGGGSGRNWVAASHALRLLLAMLVFYALSLHGWQALVAALVGFGLARWHLLRRLGGAHGNS